MLNDIEELSTDQIEMVSGGKWGAWDYLILAGATMISPVFGGVATLSYVIHKK